MTGPRPSAQADGAATWRILAEFSVPSEPGNERLAMKRVAEAVRELNLPERSRQRLGTAVAEATMNAMEHGNEYRPEAPVTIRVSALEKDLSVRITDQGGAPPGTDPDAAPDLEAKLEGTQTPRGWGLFLIKSMVDQMNITGDGTSHTVELILRLGGDQKGAEGAR